MSFLNKLDEDCIAKYSEYNVDNYNECINSRVRDALCSTVADANYLIADSDGFEMTLLKYNCVIQSLQINDNYNLLSLYGIEGLITLNHLYIDSCNGLTDIKDISNLNLMRLSLTSCINLVDVSSVFTNHSLVSIEFFNCRSIRSLKGINKLKDLKFIDIRGCTSIEDIYLLDTIKGLRVYKDILPDVSEQDEEVMAVVRSEQDEDHGAMALALISSYNKKRALLTQNLNYSKSPVIGESMDSFFDRITVDEEVAYRWKVTDTSSWEFIEFRENVLNERDIRISNHVENCGLPKVCGAPSALGLPM